MTTLIILNDDMEDILKMLKSLEEPSLLKNGVTKIIENEKKMDLLACY